MFAATYGAVECWCMITRGIIPGIARIATARTRMGPLTEFGQRAHSSLLGSKPSEAQLSAQWLWP